MVDSITFILVVVLLIYQYHFWLGFCFFRWCPVQFRRRSQFLEPVPNLENCEHYSCISNRAHTRLRYPLYEYA